MNNFLEAVYVGVGGFLGAISRWLVSQTASGWLGALPASDSWLGAFPLGTLLVNVSGSFALGFIMFSISYGKNISPEFRNFVAVGFIGAFTTMSTFCYETVRLFELKDYTLFSINFLSNIVFCLAAILAGRYLAITLFK